MELSRHDPAESAKEVFVKIDARLFAVIGFLLNASWGTAQDPVAASPALYGTQGGSIEIDAAQLSPLGSGNQYSNIYAGRGRYLTSLTGLGFMAPLHLPSGARLTAVIVYGTDSSPAGEYQVDVASCDGLGEACIVASGQPGCADAPVTACSGNTFAGGMSSVYEGLYDDDVVIDNASNRYVVVAGNTTNDGSTAISRIVVGYVLQVSPAPATPTFADVPATDPAFPFIEALSSSGITSGCGGGDYCPDGLVTRRQMAVFLAKALGLQWN